MKQIEQILSRFSSEILKEHVRLEMYEDISRDLVSVLVKTEPIGPLKTFTITTLTSEPCQWTSSWWAKSIQWMLKKDWLHWMIPHPIQCLVYATEVTQEPKSVDLPESVMDNIRAQIANLLVQGKRPERILAGCEAHKEAQKFNHFSMLTTGGYSGLGQFMLKGYPVVLCDRLEQNAVLVIEQIP